MGTPSPHPHPQEHMLLDGHPVAARQTALVIWGLGLQHWNKTQHYITFCCCLSFKRIFRTALCQKKSPLLFLLPS